MKSLIICLLLCSNVFGQSGTTTTQEDNNSQRKLEERERKRHETLDKTLFVIYSVDSKWPYIGESGTHFMFYSKESIRLRGRYSRIWSKLVSKSAELDRTRKEEPEQLKEMAYTVSLLEFDCVDSRVRMLSEIIYKADDNIIRSKDSLEDSWAFVTPDTLFWALLNKACIKNRVKKR
jgi:hypothetical protein